MIHCSRRNVLVASCVLTVIPMLTTSTSLVVAQDMNQDQSQASKPIDMLNDFIHFVLVARPDLADGSIQALLNSGISDADLYRLADEVDQDRFNDALLRAMRMDALADSAGELSVHIRRGRQDVARDPDEIAKNIKFLTGSARARMMAREALQAAGEYAVPQLLHVITAPGPQTLKTESQLMLVRIGRQAVTPLSVALPMLDTASQERICRILGDLKYQHAIPALHQLASNPGTLPRVATAAMDAYERLGGDPDATDVSLWLNIAEKYWTEEPSLTAWKGEELANVWSYDIQSGLMSTPVSSKIFDEVMAMRACRSALADDSNSQEGLALWIASNFRRSDQLPSGMTDPTYASTMREPMFYAVLAGADTAQRVLARAIADQNTPLVRHAVAALNSTAGGSNLWITDGQPAPLIAALTYPERRVRYDAALALGRALPTSTFEGAERVVPILSSAIRTGDERFAAVIASSEEDQKTIAANLRSMGFTVLPPHFNYDQLSSDLIGGVGIDLFAVMLPTSDLSATVSAVHNDPRVSASPLMLFVPTKQLDTVREDFAGDTRVGIMRLGLNNAQMTAAVNALVKANTGALITKQEADRYASASLRVLRDMAVSNSTAFDVSQAAPALLQMLNQRTGDLRLTAAETLSWIGTAESQSALLSAALDDQDGITKMILLGLVSNSAKRFGRMVGDSQVSRLTDLVKTADGELATAAAQTHGALNLPASNAVDFIVK